MKKIGIIGSGMVGRVLAAGLTKHGYKVMVGSDDKSKRENINKETGVLTGTFAKAALFGETIIFAIKGTAAEKVILSLADMLSGKTVIDTTNPIADRPPVNGVIQYFTSPDESLMERLQKSAPKANLVKGFSCAGNAFMVDPEFELKPTMFICGNNASAKREAVTLLEELGWEVEDLGKMESARAIEPLCILWCIPGFLENRWNHAFKLLKKSS